ncbi:MAG: hypothetical protein R2761_26255 [Acidimicrobiales bacterium]
MPIGLVGRTFAVRRPHAVGRGDGLMAAASLGAVSLRRRWPKGAVAGRAAWCGRR